MGNLRALFLILFLLSFLSWASSGFAITVFFMSYNSTFVLVKSKKLLTLPSWFLIVFGMMIIQLCVGHKSFSTGKAVFEGPFERFQFNTVGINMLFRFIPL